MFNQDFKLSVLARINNFQAISDLKKQGKQDHEIKIFLLASGANKNNFLLKNLLAETAYQIRAHHITRDETISAKVENYLQHLKNSYPSRQFEFSKLGSKDCRGQKFIGLSNEEIEDLEAIQHFCQKQNFDVVIFDYFSDELTDPIKAAALQSKLSQMFSSESFPDFLFAFGDKKIRDAQTDILINLPIELINFEEIFDSNKELIEEILKDEKIRDANKVNQLIERADSFGTGLDIVMRYLVTKAGIPNLLFFIKSCKKQISQKIYLHTICDLIFFNETNLHLIDDCVEHGKIDDVQINEIMAYSVEKCMQFQEVGNDWYLHTEFFYNRFKHLITEETKIRLIDSTQRIDYMVYKFFDFLVDKFSCNPAEATVRLVSFVTVKDSGSGSLEERLIYIISNHKEKIFNVHLNQALLNAQKFNRSEPIIAKLVAEGANPELTKKKKNYGWSKFLSAENSVSEEQINWVQSNFWNYTQLMNDFLFDPQYGYYSSGIVKIGGKAADFITNVTNGKGFAFFLALLSVKKWQEAGCPKKFVILELCGGNGKLANDILTIIETLSAKIPDLKDLFKSVIYRTVDISPGLSKLQQARNKRFEKLKKFGIIISDASDKKWLEKFKFKKEKGVVFCNELVDQFIPSNLIVKTKENQNRIFNSYAINYLLVNNFDDFYKLCQFEGKSLVARESASLLYSQLKNESDEFKKKFGEYFGINCADENLIIKSEALREKIILPILKPRLDKIRSLRHKIFELEEEIEEKNRKEKSANVKNLELEIELLMKDLQVFKTDMKNVWSHFVIMYLALPDKASLNDLDLKYSQNSKLYPDNDFKISYQETQFENTLKITQSLSGYEFFIFEYGKLLNESSPRNTQFYGFSWFIDDMSFNEGIQKRVEVEPQNQVCDIYSDFFLGVDITMELDFPKAEELAYSVGYKKTGLCGDQRIIDDHLKNLDIELYKKSLEILKNRNGFENLEKDVNIFRNFNKDFKVISFLSA